MRLGSFCTGYGGLDAAVENHFGAELAWYSEIEPAANQLLSTRFPEVPNLGNLKEINWAETPPVDILCAGYPCQPFSTAGNRKGETDERAIFSYIAESISVLRPRWVVLENVSGHLTLGGDAVIGSLTSMGYDCRWGVVRASDAGAPHRRARWFCLAWDTNSKNEPAVGKVQGRVYKEPHTKGTRIDFDGYTKSGWPSETGSPKNNRPTEPRKPVSETPRNTERGWHIDRGQDCINWGNYTAAIQRWENILGRPAADPVTENRHLNPVFVEWMMGLPEGWVTELGLPRTAELKMLGNGVVPQQAALALSILGADLTTK
jgi:DNA (cytosine-5)-methyltransferase 1